MNFSRIYGQFICKMAALRFFLFACMAIVLNFAIATLFAVLFVGCSMGGSTEETSQSIGGPSENPGVQASLENISVKGLAMVGARPEPFDSTRPEIGLSLSGMPKGSIVTLYELDSDSLEKTGVSYADTIDNDGGLFDIQGVTLKSPYVWITAVQRNGLTMEVDEYGDSKPSDMLSVNAFIDVRDSSAVTVDVFSDLIAYRVRVLVLIGNDFADAMAQAKREILEAFGIYGVAFDSLERSGLDYYAMQSVFVRVLFSSYGSGNLMASAPISKSFEQTGSFLREKDAVIGGVRTVMKDLRFKLSIPQAVYDDMGPQVAKEYQAMLLYEKYLAGMMSVMLGAGQCSSAQEGTSMDAFDEYYRPSGMKFSIVCRSGNWHLSYEQVPHTFGTMTDARDGNVYKTVTIDLGNKTQTWMAENLKYKGVKTSCLDDNDRNCDIYGRQYDWNVAMGLGDSIFVVEFASMQECIDTLSPRYSTTPILYDSVYIEKCIEELPEPDSIGIEKCMYYGGGIPVNYDSIRAVFDIEIRERCEEYLNATASFIDAGKVNMDSLALTQGVCPDGWRIPTFDDWESLFKYIDRKWKSITEGAFLLAAPSIGDPFGFNLYSTVEMEWDGDSLLKVEKMLADYIMISRSDDPYRPRAGFVKMTEVINTSFRFNYDAVGFDAFFRNLFVRCIKD
jgi:uncharacterized protein (TIGR02145 family)